MVQMLSIGNKSGSLHDAKSFIWRQMSRYCSHQVAAKRGKNMAVHLTGFRIGQFTWF